MATDQIKIKNESDVFEGSRVKIEQCEIGIVDEMGSCDGLKRRKIGDHRNNIEDFDLTDSSTKNQADLVKFEDDIDSHYDDIESNIIESITERKAKQIKSEIDVDNDDVKPEVNEIKFRIHGAINLKNNDVNFIDSSKSEDAKPYIFHRVADIGEQVSPAILQRNPVLSVEEYKKTPLTGPIENTVLVEHKMVDSATKKFKSGISPTSANQSLSVLSAKIDKKIQTEAKLFHCKICFKEFTVLQCFKRHERTHLGEKPFSCKVCSNAFTRSSYLKEHELTHTEGRPFQCMICYKAFSQLSNLKNHERIHTGERPFKCKICFKAFVQLGNLKAHERIHTGEKPFQCKICLKAFNQSSILKTHERIHSEEKPLQCKICSKPFRTSGNLKAHERVHTGEKQYQCSICAKNFGYSQNLKVHKRIHTK